MVNQHAAAAIAAARLDEDRGRPLYDSYCFSQVPQLIRHLLLPDAPMGLPPTVLGGLPRHYDKVILFLLDGFGWRFFAKYADRLPLLRRIVDEGVATKLTTQFPSTTSAHVSTLHLGLPVTESGVFEWWYYEPLLDRLFSPLPFSVKGEHGLERPGLPPEALFPTQTLYQELASAGIKAYCSQHRDQARSAFSQVACKGATMLPFRTLPEGLVNLTEAVAAERERAYFCVYVDVVDGISHQHGPDSRQVEAEIEALWYLLEKIVHASLQGERRTLLLFTADHGQTAVTSHDAFYLDERVPEISRWLRTTRGGQPLVPAGGPRDMFLYLKEEHLTEGHEALTAALRGHAAVHRTSTLLEEGAFGLRPTARLLDRLGNLTILPHAHKLVWWHEGGRFALHYKGHHGGLSAEEMETLLLAKAYD